MYRVFTQVLFVCLAKPRVFKFQWDKFQLPAWWQISVCLTLLACLPLSLCVWDGAFYFFPPCILLLELKLGGGGGGGGADDLFLPWNELLSWNTTLSNLSNTTPKSLTEAEKLWSYCHRLNQLGRSERPRRQLKAAVFFISQKPYREARETLKVNLLSRIVLSAKRRMGMKANWGAYKVRICPCEREEYFWTRIPLEDDLSPSTSGKCSLMGGFHVARFCVCWGYTWKSILVIIGCF